MEIKNKLKTILILTSKDHIYANIIINKIIKSGILNNKRIIVLEQEWIIPKKSKIKCLMIYLKSAGLHYVSIQVLKQYLFLIFRYLSILRKKENSIFFPYYYNNLSSFSRRKLHNFKTESSVRYISNLNPDLIISVLSKEILPESIINIPKYGCINLHPAFLPNYRGVSPTFWCLANHEEYTGATLHYINSGIDTGKIISQVKIPTSRFKTEHTLYMGCINTGAELIINFLKQLEEIRKIKTLLNSKNGSYYSIPSKTAVQKFLNQGYKFFKFKEFINANSH